MGTAGRIARWALLATAATLAASAPSWAGLGDGQGGFRLHRMAGFDRPMYVHGPAGAGRTVFVVERDGVIKVLQGGDKRKGSFLDIRDRVACCESERGLFSVAFLNWDRSRKYYVYYTDDQGDLRIDEFRRSKGSRFRTAKGSRRHVLEIPHRQAANHNGGQLQIGPDGRLYIATGDGGTGGGPAQRKDSLLGKLLRINPERQGRGKPYGVPRDNPYVGEGGRDEIYARGLRNPWRFAFDRMHLTLGDVGQDRREEVDFETLRGARGANFGWNVFEGTLPYGGGSVGRHARPIHQYDHSAGRCAITGGYVSRDRDVRSLYERYVYADLCTGQLRSLIARTGGSRDDQALGVADKPGITTFGEDARKRLYLAQQSGAVYRIVPD